MRRGVGEEEEDDLRSAAVGEGKGGGGGGGGVGGEDVAAEEGEVGDLVGGGDEGGSLAVQRPRYNTSPINLYIVATRASSSSEKSVLESWLLSAQNKPNPFKPWIQNLRCRLLFAVAPPTFSPLF
jgi:hypothetical protein